MLDLHPSQGCFAPRGTCCLRAIPLPGRRLVCAQPEDSSRRPSLMEATLLQLAGRRVCRAEPCPEQPREQRGWNWRREASPPVRESKGRRDNVQRKREDALSRRRMRGNGHKRIG